MWHLRFGLRSRPFSLTAAGELLPAALRAAQLELLEEALKAREGFGLLLGAPGLGKTFLLRRLAERLNGPFHLAWLPHARLPSLAALHQSLLFDFRQPYAEKAEQELRLAAIEQILGQAQAGRATLLVVDDAHHLEPEHLEELRLLGNLEGEDGKCLVSLLAGQAPLEAKLAGGELASLAQQIAVRVQLQPLAPEEAASFVQAQLLAAGGEPEKLLETEALELLIQLSQGVPRVLNGLCRTAFRLAADAETRCVDIEAALAAAEEFGFSLDEQEAEEPAALSLRPAAKKLSA